MSARGSIGWHLAKAHECSQVAWILASRDLDVSAARRDGAAAGHAFRAAELAYDLGQRHAQERATRAKEASWGEAF